MYRLLLWVQTRKQSVLQPITVLMTVSYTHLDVYKRQGLGTDGIIYGGKRMGLYFLESGAAFRNSNVVYDREGSSLSLIHILCRHRPCLGRAQIHCSGVRGCR